MTESDKHYSFFLKAKYIDDSKDIMVQFRPLLEEVFFVELFDVI